MVKAIGLLLALRPGNLQALPCEAVTEDNAPTTAGRGRRQRARGTTRSVSGRLARIVAAVIPDDTHAVQAGLVAPGGYGSGEVLGAVSDRLIALGTTPLSMVGRRLERAHPFAALAECVDVGVIIPDTTDNSQMAEDLTTERQCRDLLVDRLHSEAAALLVDDCQWLDDATLRTLVGIVERADYLGLTVIAAHRPAPRQPTLAALDAALSRHHPLIRLGPLDQEETAERAALVLGRTVDPAFVENLHEQTAGVLTFVDQLAVAWAPRAEIPADGRHQRREHASRRSVDDPTRPIGADVTTAVPRAVPAGLVEAVRIEVEQLPPVSRTVLAALSAGADLDDELLGSVTGLAPAELGEAIEALEAAGLLVHEEHAASHLGWDVVPVVAAAMSELTPMADRRRFHASLAQALAGRGAPPTRAAEHLAAAGAQGPEAARAYIAAAEASLADAPELARAWFDRAAAAGAVPQEIAAPRAEAAALDGDIELALRMADSVASDPMTPHRRRALGVVAALLPARGFWRRSAETYERLGVDHASETTADAANDATHDNKRDHAHTKMLGLIGSVVAGSVPDGRPDQSAAMRFESLLESMLEPVPATASLELEALTLTARGLVTSLGREASGVELSFLEAAELLESAHTRLLLPDTPHAFGATVALALCELSTAEHLLSRALERDVGGRALRLRHRLLYGWVALRSGRWSAARTALEEARIQQAGPRERLLADAIDAGLARRAGDLPRLTEAWRRAEGVLLRHAPDLMSLDAVGELTITASRLGHWDRVSAKARELGDVLRALDEPPLWLLPLRWTGLQVALASDDHQAVRRRAAEIEAITPVHGRLGALAQAARTWVAILDGAVEPTEVTTASKGLEAMGLTWEASRLVGQGAIRSSDPSVTRALLEQARDLRAALPTAEVDQAPSAANVLSEREQMVAQYIVDGVTYKEIGAQLYISPKTVEHHVAKIRQKLGASTRAEMLAALRTL